MFDYRLGLSLLAALAVPVLAVTLGAFAPAPDPASPADDRQANPAWFRRDEDDLDALSPFRRRNRP